MWQISQKVFYLSADLRTQKEKKAIKPLWHLKATGKLKKINPKTFQGFENKSIHPHDVRVTDLWTTNSNAYNTQFPFPVWLIHGKIPWRLQRILLSFAKKNICRSNEVPCWEVVFCRTLRSTVLGVRAATQHTLCNHVDCNKPQAIKCREQAGKVCTLG